MEARDAMLSIYFSEKRMPQIIIEDVVIRIPKSSEAIRHWERTNNEDLEIIICRPQTNERINCCAVCLSGAKHNGAPQSRDACVSVHQIFECSVNEDAVFDCQSQFEVTSYE